MKILFEYFIIGAFLALLVLYVSHENPKLILNYSNNPNHLNKLSLCSKNDLCNL